MNIKEKTKKVTEYLEELAKEKIEHWENRDKEIRYKNGDGNELLSTLFYSALGYTYKTNLSFQTVGKIIKKIKRKFMDIYISQNK